MADNDLAILAQGVASWNTWRENHPEIVRPDLSGADLSEADLYMANLRGAKLIEANLRESNLMEANLTDSNLRGADLRGADLRGANLSQANLRRANLSGADLYMATLRESNLSQANLSQANLMEATLRDSNLMEANLTGANLSEANLSGAYPSQANLSGADLRGANLSGADLSQANLSGADLSEAILREANLSRADLSGAHLEGASLVRTSLEQTIFTGCKTYGLSVWDMQGTPKDQSGLIITPHGSPEVTVDDLEVAQFVYLLLTGEKLRNVVNTITSKAVLILGRFTPERKPVLDAMADELRTYNLLPISFDFERSTPRDFTETIKILAGLSLFVIADITNPKSAPLELQAMVPDYQIPFVAILEEGEKPFSMFSDLPQYDWVLKPVVEYRSLEKLRQSVKPAIIDRAWRKHQALQAKKTGEIKVQSIEDFTMQDGS